MVFTRGTHHGRRSLGGILLLSLMLSLLGSPVVALEGEVREATFSGELAIDLSSGFGLQVQPLPHRVPGLYLDYHRNRTNTGTSVGARYVLKHEGSGIRLNFGSGARFTDTERDTRAYLLAGLEWFVFWESEWILHEEHTREQRAGIRLRFR